MWRKKWNSNFDLCDYKNMAKTISIRRKDLIKKATKEEMLVLSALRNQKIRFTFQKGTMCHGYGVRIVDFYIHRPYRCIIEVDGGYHENIKQQDEKRENQIKKNSGIRNLKFIRITNKQVNEWNNKHLLEYNLIKLLNEILISKNITSNEDFMIGFQDIFLDALK